jgi:hypothetical protein
VKTRVVVLAAIVALTIPLAASPCTESLDPTLFRELPLSTLRRAQSVAWIDDASVAIGADNGVFTYGLAKGALRQVVPRATLPDIEDIATDGRTLVAYNQDYSDIAVDLASGKVLSQRTRTPGLQMLDIAVRDRSMFVLGFPVPFKRNENGVVWRGGIGGKWETFRKLLTLDQEATMIVQAAFAPLGGAMVVQKDGTIAAISPAEAGVMRVRADGTILPALGVRLSELVVPRLHEVRRIFARDVNGRYAQILNKQPIADDLVETSDGLAVVVRRANAGKIGWELWFPEPAGGATRRIRLGLQDQRIAGGHLRCHARGTRMACLFGKATKLFSPDVPYLAVFDLARVKRSAGC